MIDQGNFFKCPSLICTLCSSVFRSSTSEVCVTAVCVVLVSVLVLWVIIMLIMEDVLLLQFCTSLTVFTAELTF